MGYPQSPDYNEAVQNPRLAFTDTELQTGTVLTDALGLPLALSGGFALTYTVTCGRRKYAVRCFHRDVPTVEAKYDAISAGLRANASPYFIGFKFQPAGVRVRGKAYPIVRMEWAEGELLGAYLDRNVSRRDVLGALRQQFREAASALAGAGIAHGDLQNGNVIVTRSGIRLIDYDGLFVPGMTTGNGSETGHKHFQHPARTARDFGPTMDRFSFIVIDVSLSALMERPDLHRRFSAGGETMVFRANDFADPDNSEIFRILGELPAVREHASRLADICKAPLDQCPSLEDFLAGHVPRRAARTVARAVSAVRPPGRLAYIGAYTVVDATDYAAALDNVGNRVELVGQVMEVKKSFTKYGKPYVFINFGDWRGNITKLTLWSEVLVKFDVQPDDTWIGRYVSVTGLINPPYSKHTYGNAHLSISVSEPSEIEFIDEEEAAYRLGTADSSDPILTSHAAVEGRVSALLQPPGPVASPHARGESLNSRVTPQNLSTAPPTHQSLTSNPPAQAVNAHPKGSNRAILDAIRSRQGTHGPAPAASTIPVPPAEVQPPLPADADEPTNSAWKRAIRRLW